MYLAQRVTGNMDANYDPIDGRKSGSVMFYSQFGMEIFFLYHEDNHLRIKFWVKNTLVASRSRDLIALKMC